MQPKVYVCVVRSHPPAHALGRGLEWRCACVQSSLQGLMSNPSLSQFISNLAKDSSFADMANLGFNSGIPDSNGLSLGAPPGGSDFTTAPVPGNSALPDGMRTKRGFPDDFSTGGVSHHSRVRLYHTGPALAGLRACASTQSAPCQAPQNCMSMA